MRRLLPSPSLPLAATLLLLWSQPVLAAWQEIELPVDGVPRQALLWAPDGLTDTVPDDPPLSRPLVLVFHGHGGGRHQAARSFALHEAWPEAFVVYPEGLPTPGRLTDPAGLRRGWQHGAGDQGDRDLHWVDALLDHLLTSRPIDPHRVFATGHSNGGGFTYLLWAARSDRFAAFAPSAASGARSLRSARPPPRPLFHVLGRNDPLVQPAWQRATVAAACRLNGAPPAPAPITASPWTDQPDVAWHHSADGPPVAVFTHDGGHRFPPAATVLIARFFHGINPATGPAPADHGTDGAEVPAPAARR